MFPLSDEIELLVCPSGTRLYGNGDEILAEVACCGVDEEALSVGGFEGYGCEGSGCGIVALVRFCC